MTRARLLLLPGEIDRAARAPLAAAASRSPDRIIIKALGRTLIVAETQEVDVQQVMERIREARRRRCIVETTTERSSVSDNSSGSLDALLFGFQDYGVIGRKGWVGPGPAAVAPERNA